MQQSPPLACRSASHRPVAWAHRRVEVERRHDARLVAALYNQTFSVVGVAQVAPVTHWHSSMQAGHVHADGWM